MPEHASKQKPNVSVLLVNWNGLTDTLGCLASLADVTYPDHTVLVVDNGSTANEAQAIQAAHPKVTVLQTGRNLGFSGGNNVGIRHALAQGADYILCLNNDTIVAPDFLDHLVDAAESDPDVGMTVAKIFYYDAPDTVWYAGAECRFDSDSLGRGRPYRHLPPEEQPAQTTPYETHIATGCALLVRAALMRQLGGFDERYFAYYEDVDLSLRAEQRGMRRVVVPRARVWHKVSRSSGGSSSPQVFYYLIRNLSLLAQTHAPGRAHAGRAFYHAYVRPRLKEAWAVARDPAAGAGPRARAQACLSAFWCAQLGLYGRREDHPRIEGAAATWLRFAAVRGRIVAELMRPYWYVNARVSRRLKQR